MRQLMEKKNIEKEFKCLRKICGGSRAAAQLKIFRKSTRTARCSNPPVAEVNPAITKPGIRQSISLFEFLYYVWHAVKHR